MSRLKVALTAAVVLLAGVAAIPAYGVDAVVNGRLAFVADEAGKPQVFTVKPDGSGLTRLTNRPHGVVEYGLAWSPDASSLLMILGGSHDHDLQGRHERRGRPPAAHPRCVGQLSRRQLPDIQPSGAKIAFERAFGPERNDTAVPLPSSR